MELIKKMKHNLSFFLLLAITNFLLQDAYGGKTSEVCISQGGRFPQFANEGKPPKKASKGHKDMTLCRVFRKRSCCDVTQTHPALLSIRRLASSGEANQDCLQLWEFLECSICDPRVGVQPGPPCICASFCNRVYEACSTAYFSMDVKTQVLAPCGSGDFVCGKASEWVSNGTELCHASGFSVSSFDDPEETSCYGGKSGLDYITNSWKTSRSDILHGNQNTGVVEYLRHWIANMSFSERISWAIGGMVLTAGIVFASKRKSHNQRQKQIGVQRRAKKLGTKINSVSPVGQENRRGTGR
ncbi:folate-binding protein 1 isoform X1 [Henckelia pumila]|uniref:folate-binding protein 1 isoform X1 n=1 Tax=Henckelia pumila TaxID=405737 RepID=UPI003C6E27F8